MKPTCPTCRRINPTEALFCYFDGRSLAGIQAESLVPVEEKPFPAPFYFPSGKVCQNFNELVQTCQDHWAEAQDMLREGFFYGFLTGIGRADLAKIAEVAARSADPVQGLEDFLRAVPNKVRKSAQLEVTPTEILAGTVRRDQRTEAVLHIRNPGNILLQGTISCEETPWLSVGDTSGAHQRMFRCTDEMRLPVQILGHRCRASTKPLEGKILIESNGGSATVMVQVIVPVRAFSEGVLAGATSPREIATKAKAQPREAAPLFEQGKVADWFALNGWIYPIQGTPVTGLGAIQQFFEALGLVPPPPLEISEEQVLLRGAPGQVLDHDIFVSTKANRPVYAQATSTASWIQVNPIVQQGRTARIPLRVRAEAARTGETLQGRVLVTGNGNQRFAVTVTLQIRLDPSAPARGDVPQVLNMGDVDEAPPPRPLRSSGVPPRSERVASLGAEERVASLGAEERRREGEKETKRQKETSTAGREHPQIPPIPDTLPSPSSAPPPPRSSAPPPPRSSAPPLPRSERSEPGGGRRPILKKHYLPLLILLLLIGGVIVHDVLLSASADPGPKERGPDHEPLLMLRIHKRPRKDVGADVTYRSNRFGVIMVRESEPKKLTFDERGESNNTVLKIDDKEVLFGSPAGRWVEESRRSMQAGVLGGAPAYLLPEQWDFHSVWEQKDQRIEVTQIVEIIYNEQSQRFDTCLIRYVLVNKDTQPHRVGLRMMLDTYIGANDGVPFFIPGENELCRTNKRFANPKEIPDFIEALEHDDLQNPGTVARVQFRVNDKIEGPSEVLLGGWPDVKLTDYGYQKAKAESTMWEVPEVSMQFLHQRTRLDRKVSPEDSAVTLYWKTDPLQPGQKREVGFAYGLGNVASQEGKGKLLLTIGGRLERKGEITVATLVKDPSPGETVTLTLPDGFELLEGSAEQQVPPPSKDGRGQSPVSWKVRVGNEDGAYELRVRSSTGATQSQTIRIKTRGVFD